MSPQYVRSNRQRRARICGEQVLGGAHHEPACRVSRTAGPAAGPLAAVIHRARGAAVFSVVRPAQPTGARKCRTSAGRPASRRNCRKAAQPAVTHAQLDRRLQGARWRRRACPRQPRATQRSLRCCRGRRSDAARATFSAWLGVDPINWHKYAVGPIWLHFSSQFRQTKDIETRLRTWAREHAKFLREDKDGLMLHLPLLTGRELHVVTEDLIDQLRVIAEVLRPSPAAPAAP